MWGELTPKQREIISQLEIAMNMDELDVYIICRKILLGRKIEEECRELARMEQEANEPDS